MKKVYLSLFLLLSIFLVSACSSGSKDEKNRAKAVSDGQPLFQETMDISVKYLDLRLRTDEILTKASSYNDYEEWQADLNQIMTEWRDLEIGAIAFEETADKYSKNKKLSLLNNSFLPTNLAQAYSTKEINDIFDKAPAGKKIKTLASHLGVDAKRAFAILQQAQNQVQADAWNEAGDTFQTLETSAVVVKDACKVVGFVGGIAISGGTAGLAAAGTATKVAVAVSGADLVLEVSQDAATIALGNNNQVSEFIADARVVTEPAAAILAITTIPKNIGTGFDKFNATMLALDQFNSAAQDGKVVGVALPSSKDSKIEKKISGGTMTEEEIDEWLAGLGLKRTDKDSFEVIKEVKERIEEVKNSQERIAQANVEKEEIDKESEISEEGSLDYNSSEEDMVDPMSIDALQREMERDLNTSYSDINIFIDRPDGTEFYKSQARGWRLVIEGYNPGPGALKMCHWTFYLDGVKFKEMPDNKGCGFTSTFIDQKGSLKAEVRIDFLQGRSVFDESGNFVEYVQDVVHSLTTSREYQVI